MKCFHNKKIQKKRKIREVSLMNKNNNNLSHNKIIKMDNYLQNIFKMESTRKKSQRKLPKFRKHKKGKIKKRNQDEPKTKDLTL